MYVPSHNLNFSGFLAYKNFFYSLVAYLWLIFRVRLGGLSILSYCLINFYSVKITQIKQTIYITQ
jgi:hypothetical protein